MSKVVVDKERSDKAIIENSVLGKLLMSDYVCKNCGTPVLAKEWVSCAKCGGEVAIPKSKFLSKTDK